MAIDEQVADKITAMEVDQPLYDASHSVRGMRANTLLWLRWMMISSQLIAVFVVGVVFKFPVPMIESLSLVAIGAISNLFLRFRSVSTSRLDGGTVTLYLAFDIFQYSGLLFLNGGLENPFVIQLLIPVMIAATTLNKSNTLILGGLVVVTASFLVDFHYPLPWSPDNPINLPILYTISIWISMMVGLVFMGIYAFRVSNEARSLSTALAATELVLAREQHLSDLDGLAAAAAHELGTPLSTISVVSRELERELPEDSPYRSDVELLSSQAKRCRDILGKLSSLGNEQGGPMRTVKLSDMIEELVDPHRNFGINITVEQHSSLGKDTQMPELSRLPGVLYGLANLIENAVDFARSEVNVVLAWDEDAIIVKILDDGPGFSETVADKLGEPYVTSRQQRIKADGPAVEGGGLGLGIFIAKTLLERSGATMNFGNRGGSIRGADVTIAWNRERICVPD